MTEYPVTWLLDVLAAKGLKVAEVDGWRTRGLDRPFDPKGVIVHHTGGPPTGNMPSLGIVTNGRADLQGPLSQLALGRDGTFYVVAAGFAHHAGAGAWRSTTTGNTNFIGIECENTGLVGDAWPAIQIDALRTGIAAILTYLKTDSTMCCGHKEWALPIGRKVDPSFDMAPLRAAITATMAETQPPRPLIPAVDAQNRPTIRRGMAVDAVTTLQQMMKLPVDGQFGAATEAAVRAWQSAHALVPDGIVGPATWESLFRQASPMAGST